MSGLFSQIPLIRYFTQDRLHMANRTSALSLYSLHPICNYPLNSTRHHPMVIHNTFHFSSFAFIVPHIGIDDWFHSIHWLLMKLFIWIARYNYHRQQFHVKPNRTISTNCQFNSTIISASNGCFKFIYSVRDCNSPAFQTQWNWSSTLTIISNNQEYFHYPTSNT